MAIGRVESTASQRSMTGARGSPRRRAAETASPAAIVSGSSCPAAHCTLGASWGCSSDGSCGFTVADFRSDFARSDRPQPILALRFCRWLAERPLISGALSEPSTARLPRNDGRAKGSAAPVWLGYARLFGILRGPRNTHVHLSERGAID